MPRTRPFDELSHEYEAWFDRHVHVYTSEVEALRSMIPRGGRGVEIGMGTGRFAGALGIAEGVEPSAAMRRVAARQGLAAVDAVAEVLPYPDASFDFAVMVTTICFVDDVHAAFREVRRILRPGGSFIVGLVDRDSALGRAYEQMKEGNAFYRIATFYSTDEVKQFLQDTGFGNVEVVQTVFGRLEEIDSVQAWREGYGEGGFVVLRATKMDRSARMHDRSRS